MVSVDFNAISAVVAHGSSISAIYQGSELLWKQFLPSLAVKIRNGSQVQFEQDETTAKLTMVSSYSDPSLIGVYAQKISNKQDIIEVEDLSSSITATGNYAFCKISNLSAAKLDSLVTLGTHTFDATGLSVADFPSVTYAGGYAFQDCSKLVQIKMPALTSFGELIVNGCNNLSSIIVDNSFLKSCENGYGTPNSLVLDSKNVLKLATKTLTRVSSDSVTEIGAQAFYRCKYLSSVSFANATKIGRGAFLGVGQSSRQFGEHLDIPKATTIDSNAFSQACLSSIALSSVTSINSSAFNSCTNLLSIDFQAMQTVGSSAFLYCPKLQIAVIPRAKTLQSSSFKNCASLSSVVLSAVDTVTTITTSTFQKNASPISVFVPSSLSSDFEQDATWKTFIEDGTLTIVGV